MFLGLEKFLAKWTFINVHFPKALINIEKKREKVSCDHNALILIFGRKKL
jgi:hypothetical protein